jgi:hypothetical protein
MEEIKVQLIFTDAALAAALEEIETRKARLQASLAEPCDEALDARNHQLEKP